MYYQKKNIYCERVEMWKFGIYFQIDILFHFCKSNINLYIELAMTILRIYVFKHVSCAV